MRSYLQIRTQAISCKALTMITPIQLLLFGCRRGVWRIDNPENPASNEYGVVLLDDWLPLRMRYATAARIFALRPALEALLVRICLQPAALTSMSPENVSVVEMTKALCEQTALKGVVAGELRTGGGYQPRGNRFNMDFNRPLLAGGRRRVGPEMDTATFNRYEVRGGYRGRGGGGGGYHGGPRWSGGYGGGYGGRGDYGGRGRDRSPMYRTGG